MKIAIIKTGAVGDVLRTTSLLPGLKEKYKNSSITWIVAKKAYDIIKTNPLIDEILIMEDIRKIDNSFDIVINLEEDRKACELATEIDKKRLFGAYSQNRKITYSDDSKDWFDLSLISRHGKEKADELKKRNRRSYQEIISESLGIKVSRPILALEEEWKTFAERFKRDNDMTNTDFVIGINTDAGKRWKYKSLGPRKTLQLVKEIKKGFNIKIIIFGNSGDKEIIQQTKTIDACNNNSLLEFVSLVNLCHILITSDSLALHIAAALNKKIIAFFGPTSPSEIELYGNGIKIVPKMNCIGCYKNDCDFNPVCMDMIEISGFIDSIKKLIRI